VHGQVAAATCCFPW